MKKPVTFASSFRIKAALCCSVAVLLTACGGMADESANQQLLADTVASATPEATNAMATGTVDAGPAAPETVAQETAMPDPAPAPIDNGVATAAPATQTADGSAPTSNDFNLNGYQDAASSSDASPQATPAAASVDGQQAMQLPAA
ncbi:MULTISPECIES: hypothetical protein [Massilia]|uniref:Lipoprotein n=1 Tax=Massilia aurea TaxID=373040 RepID=A0A422QGD3_9BURK|nr:MULTISPECIES: hypothetical protein [Massilia]MDY0964074.1 hypothetical protein [Massilia sp. CFBP9026]RNF29009.1 hypothetical protein NM04_20145 [Massilia aurea]